MLIKFLGKYKNMVLPEHSEQYDILINKLKQNIRVSMHEVVFLRDQLMSLEEEGKIEKSYFKSLFTETDYLHLDASITNSNIDNKSIHYARYVSGLKQRNKTNLEQTVSSRDVGNNNKNSLYLKHVSNNI